MRGSSPRGRGKPRTSTCCASRAGLIPARAGKTRPSPSPMKWAQAHPRAGGENFCPDPSMSADSGSSPRGRGKPHLGAHLEMRLRLIPARAGKTLRSRRLEKLAAAHPRAGGENDPFKMASAVRLGSSPRGRGKRDRRHCRPGRDRLIPARAGKTVLVAMICSPKKAHPRAGGENQNASRLSAAWSGSSPRGRGKLRRPGWRCGARGLIPARAGKTPASRHQRASGRAHPRAGGENTWQAQGA